MVIFIAVNWTQEEVFYIRGALFSGCEIAKDMEN